MYHADFWLCVLRSSHSATFRRARISIGDASKAWIEKYSSELKNVGLVMHPFTSMSRVPKCYEFGIYCDFSPGILPSLDNVTSCNVKTWSGEKTREILRKLPKSLQNLSMHAIDDCDGFPHFPDLKTLTLYWPWRYATANLTRLNERCPTLTSLCLCFEVSPSSLESFRGFKGLDKLAIQCTKRVDLD